MNLRPLLILAPLALVVCAGCSSPDDGAAPADSTEADLGKASRTIVFEENGSVTLPGSLRAGQTLLVHYPIAGRAACPDGGEESVLGAFSIDHGPASPEFFLGAPTSDGKFYTAKIKVPHGHSLALWFFRKDIGQRVTCFDSNEGRNFVLPISG